MRATRETPVLSLRQQDKARYCPPQDITVFELYSCMRLSHQFILLVCSVSSLPQEPETGTVQVRRPNPFLPPNHSSHKTGYVKGDHYPALFFPSHIFFFHSTNLLPTLLMQVIKELHQSAKCFSHQLWTLNFIKAMTLLLEMLPQLQYIKQTLNNWIWTSTVQHGRKKMLSYQLSLFVPRIGSEWHCNTLEL